MTYKFYVTVVFMFASLGFSRNINTSFFFGRCHFWTTTGEIRCQPTDPFTTSVYGVLHAHVKEVRLNVGGFL